MMMSRSFLSAAKRSARPHFRSPATPTRPLSTSSPRFARYARFNVDLERSLDVRRWDTRTKVLAGLVAGGGVYYVTHLEQVPETGRWRFMDVNPKDEVELAKTAREQLLQQFKGKLLPPNHALTRHVRRIVTRILDANDLGYLPSSGPATVSSVKAPEDLWDPPAEEAAPSESSPETGGREWSLLVVNDDKMVNAMANYGNIIVFTGILPVARDEEGLAAILSHEIGHVVARHNSEHYSSSRVLLGLLYALELAGLDFGVARLLSTLFYSLPNSRTQEYEADKIGLKLASKACYDPRAAPEMFKRMMAYEKSQGGGMSFDFISTHPAADKRVKQLEDMLPEAYATQAATPECSSVRDSLGAFRDTFAHGFDARGHDASPNWRWG